MQVELAFTSGDDKAMLSYCTRYFLGIIFALVFDIIKEIKKTR